MLEEKAISKEEYEEAVNYKLVFTNSEETPERMALCRKLFCFPTLIGTETTIPAV